MVDARYLEMSKLCIVGIISARMDSKRMPGKVLKNAGDRPLLGLLFDRLKQTKGLSRIIVATTTRDTDDLIVEYAANQGVDAFRGSLNDVSFRILNCAEKYKSDYFVRINGDSPFVDPELLSSGIAHCVGEKYDLITNIINRTFPYGISVEIIRTKKFAKVYQLMNNSRQKEHVTQYFYENLNEFRYKSMLSTSPHLRLARLAIDTEQDWMIFEELVAQLGEEVIFADFKEVASKYLDILDKADNKNFIKDNSER